MTIPLQDAIVYGPIPSRRLGVSLGINILPTSSKFCLSSCIYCQYGPTDKASVKVLKLPSKEAVAQEVEKGLKNMAAQKRSIDTISICGNGEPTLHPELKAITLEVMKLRDRYYPQSNVGLFSDSSRVYLKEVREVLELVDRRYMKWDVGDEETYRRLNQPLANVSWEKMMQGLRELPSVILQSLFVRGPVNNSEGEPYRKWLETVKVIHPDEVYVYTIDRPPADARVEAVDRNRLTAIQSDVEKTIGIPASVF